MQDRIVNALEQWEPRILVQTVDVEADPSDPQAAIATITYKLVATQSQERVSLNVTFAS
jgi:phage baseplate assembly protein W